MEVDTMTFKLSPELKRDIRVAAAMRGISPSEFLRLASERELKATPAARRSKRPAPTAA